MRNRIGVNEDGAVRTGHCPSSVSNVARRCSARPVEQSSFPYRIYAIEKCRQSDFRRVFFFIRLSFVHTNHTRVSDFVLSRRAQNSIERSAATLPSSEPNVPPTTPQTDTTVRVFRFFYFRRSVRTFCTDCTGGKNRPIP